MAGGTTNTQRGPARISQVRGQIARLLLPLGIFSLVVNALLLVVPLYMLQIYDRVLPTQSTATLTYLSLIATAALVVLGLMEVVRAVMASRAATRMEATLGADALVVSMMRGRATQGDIQPLRDLSSVKQFVSSRAVFSLIDLPFAPLFIAILYLIHPALFLLTLAGVVVLLGLALINQWLVSKAQRTSGENSMRAQAHAQALTRNSESLRAMGMIDAAVSRWGEAQAQSMHAHGTVDGRNAVMSGISRTVRMGLQIAILGYGAWLVLAGEMTAGMIFASSIISGRALQPIDQVIGGWRQYVQTWSAWKRIGAALAPLQTDRTYTPMPEPKGVLSVENLTVRNPVGRPDQPILDRVSLRLQPGQALAVLGPSGSGKSTLVRALIGAVAPDLGVVRLDGSDMRNWDPAAIGRNIGYVAQEVELLPGTIASNIARLDPEPDPDKLQQAAERAEVTNLIKTLPGGYDTPVGAGGMGLSGGERQRVALARAFYGNPKLLILDEPNASLDEAGERALHRAVATARRAGATVVMVSQRDLPLEVADLVLHMVDGKVDYFGEPEPFYKKRAEFRREQKQRRRAAAEAQVRRLREESGGSPAPERKAAPQPAPQTAPVPVAKLAETSEPAPAPSAPAEPKPKKLGPVARKRLKRQQS